MANEAFRMVLDGEKPTNSLHLVTALGRQDPFAGETLCGVKSSKLTDFGRSCREDDREVCEACMTEAHDRWRAARGKP